MATVGNFVTVKAVVRQARLPTPVLACAAAGSRHTRCRVPDVNGRQAADRSRSRRTPMSTATYADAPVEVDAEGFLQRREQWTEQRADEIPAETHVGPLTARHWEVINFMRKTYLDTRSAPSIRTLGKAS